MHSGLYVPYPFEQEPFKELLKGHLTIYAPSHLFKHLPFDARNVHQVKGDNLLVYNQYDSNPLDADAYPDIPEYAEDFVYPVNITEERLEDYKFHLSLREEFKELKKLATHKMNKMANMEEIKRRFNEYHKNLVRKMEEYRASKVRLIDESEPKTQYFLTSEEEKEHVRSYLENVHQNRPEMLKNEQDETEFDFDFEINEKDYNPWDEYKMIYRDLFKKGRLHYIIKSIPEWAFLRVDKPKSFKINMSEYNPSRPDMNDSIFNIIMTEKYFDEREKKINIRKGRSESIRI